ncbi:type IX secretion system protein PorD [Mariniflexile sp.]|uniref:type IX secretion system protein PorD n=1 Tax=Mariniflexile sp. TaxID=1979402 RepID=UPI0040478B39
MRNILIFLMFGSVAIGFSQELNCNVVVDAQQTGNENFPIFKTLEKQLKEFVNNTKWTNKTFTAQERIDCSMVINIVNYSGEAFQASLQVQSSRPVFGSSFTTPIYNFNDKDFNFRYIEFQNLIFNPTQYESNLVSVLAFHIYMVLGLDAESFAENGGEPYFKQAQTITNYSQQENFKGWKLEDGLQSRFALIDNISSPTFKEYKQVLYMYHRKGLDVMSGNVKDGKEQIAASLKLFQTMNGRRPNSFLLRTFFDAKADEIEQIFSDGPNVNIASVKETLQKVAPMHSSKWQNIKF